MRTYTRFLATYDAGWLLATVVAVLLAGSGAAGEVWIIYQTVAAASLATHLAASVNSTYGEEPTKTNSFRS